MQERFSHEAAVRQFLALSSQYMLAGAASPLEDEAAPEAEPQAAPQHAARFSALSTLVEAEAGAMKPML